MTRRPGELSEAAEAALLLIATPDRDEWTFRDSFLRAVERALTVRWFSAAMALAPRCALRMISEVESDDGPMLRDEHIFAAELFEDEPIDGLLRAFADIFTTSTARDLAYVAENGACENVDDPLLCVCDGRRELKRHAVHRMVDEGRWSEAEAFDPTAIIEVCARSGRIRLERGGQLCAQLEFAVRVRLG